jgi:hypothetical protein
MSSSQKNIYSSLQSYHLNSNDRHLNAVRGNLHLPRQAYPYERKQPLSKTIDIHGARKAPQKTSFIATLAMALPTTVPFALPGKKQNLNAVENGFNSIWMCNFYNLQPCILGEVKGTLLKAIQECYKGLC